VMRALFVINKSHVLWASSGTISISVYG
jgi:hypothetical protein